MTLLNIAMCLYYRTENELIRTQLVSLYYINKGPYSFRDIIYPILCGLWTRMGVLVMDTIGVGVEK